MAHSSLIFQAFRPLLTVSFHRNIGLPLGRFPSIFISATARMFSLSPLLLTCPNHSSLLRLIISSFLQCSNRLTPIAHRTILISLVVSSRPLPIAPFLSLLLSAHAHCPSHHYYLSCCQLTPIANRTIIISLVATRFNL